MRPADAEIEHPVLHYLRIRRRSCVRVVGDDITNFARLVVV